MPVTHNPQAHQFESHEGGLTARLQYYVEGNVMDIYHTEVPAALAGRGIASQLARAAIAYAAEHKLILEPSCPFVREYLAQHPQ